MAAFLVLFSEHNQSQPSVPDAPWNNKLKRTYEALSELVVETKADLDHLDSISTALSLSEDEKDLQLIKDELSDYGYIKSHGKKKGKKQAKSSETLKKSNRIRYESRRGY